MTAEWHYGEEEPSNGPVSLEELKQLVASGQVQPTHMVWKAGMPEWRAAGDVEELFPKQATVSEVHPKALPTPERTSGPQRSAGGFLRVMAEVGVARRAIPVSSCTRREETGASFETTSRQVVDERLHAYAIALAAGNGGLQPVVGTSDDLVPCQHLDRLRMGHCGGLEGLGSPKNQLAGPAAVAFFARHGVLQPVVRIVDDPAVRKPSQRGSQERIDVLRR